MADVIMSDFFNSILHYYNNLLLFNHQLISTFSHFHISTFFLMFKMPEAGYYHCQVIFLAVFNRVVITYRTTRLYKSCNTGFMPQLYTIIKREKSIAGHYSTR